MAELQALDRRQNLKDLVVEASRALATLDADRLEELALSCQALNRELPRAGADDHSELMRQALEAAPDMEVFSRVLEVTRANLDVINRLRALRVNRLEYGEQLKRGWTPAESTHGEH